MAIPMPIVVIGGKEQKRLMPRNHQIQIGYKLTSEEFPARDLVRFARAAEEHGFAFASISDHFHPWTDRQGQSPFVWSVIGGIAQVTSKLVIGTGVTCPSFRIHPVIIAQAAATVATSRDRIFVHQIGPNQLRFMEFYAKEIFPRVRELSERALQAA